MISLVLVLLGLFDLEEIMQAAPVFGVFFFMFFIMAMFFILMNIFLAILGEAYSVVREEAQNEKNKQVQTKKRGLMGWLRLIRLLIRAKLRKRRLARQARKAEPKKTSTTNKVMPTAGTMALQAAEEGDGGALAATTVTFEERGDPVAELPPNSP